MSDDRRDNLINLLVEKLIEIKRVVRQEDLSSGNSLTSDRIKDIIGDLEELKENTSSTDLTEADRRNLIETANKLSSALKKRLVKIQNRTFNLKKFQKK